mmetsp:Transcript_11755/g.36734  ORF Transcript_11755/g.36734 Transcript_11755/m.36734 type:complete len:227 (-) Transcript_11755:153-833(-)
MLPQGSAAPWRGSTSCARAPRWRRRWPPRPAPGSPRRPGGRRRSLGPGPCARAGARASTRGRCRGSPGRCPRRPQRGGAAAARGRSPQWPPGLRPHALPAAKGAPCPRPPAARPRPPRPLGGQPWRTPRATAGRAPPPRGRRHSPGAWAAVEAAPPGLRPPGQQVCLRQRGPGQHRGPPAGPGLLARQALSRGLARTGSPTRLGELPRQTRCYRWRLAGSMRRGAR